MKKVVCFLLLLLVTAGLLSGCGGKSTPGGNGSPAPAGVQGLEQALALPDEKLVNKYCSDVDLCLGDSLLFASAQDISSETLFTFFCYITGSREYGENYQDKWYNKAENKYRVPASDIEAVLNRYFDGIHFDPAQINGYQAQTKEIVTGGLGGFGGARFPKLVQKEQLNNDTLKLMVDYCDDAYKTVLYTKAYTIRFTADGYQYLSIEKVL